MEKYKFGRIVNLTSGAPFNCFENFGAYSSSKAMMNALTLTLANELSQSNVKVNLMSPGPVRTRMAPEAPMNVNVCLPTVRYLLDINQDGPSGKFFWLGRELPCIPDLSGIDWLNGEADERYESILE